MQTLKQKFIVNNDSTRYSMSMNSTLAVILAAGKGTRLKSELPKVLHNINNKPMIHHVMDACQNAQINDICLVVGYKKDDVLSACKSYQSHHCIQTDQLGTGHAVMCAIDAIQTTNAQQVIILAGDCPLIQPKTLQNLINVHESTNASATLLTGTLPDAKEYGRIIRNKNNIITAIQEAKDCTTEQRTINEFNSGIYCFNSNDLIQSINQIQTNNTQNEYYLTDIIELLSNAGKTISGHCIDTVYEVLGANTQDELNALNQQAMSLAQSHTI